MNRTSLLLLPLPLFALFSCSRASRPGSAEVPAGLAVRPGVFVDVNPRWSHDGQRIAFLRTTPDRKLQLSITDANLKHVEELHPPELVCPDRPYSPALQRYNSPDTLAWSPDDRQIAFERIEWFTFDDGGRLPGTALWTFDTVTHAVQPLALHASTYKNIFYYFHTPQWSPDGRLLAFVGEGINGERVLFVRPISAQKVKEVTPRFDNYEDSDWPGWKPDIPPGKREEEGTHRPTTRRPSLAFRQGIVHALSTPRTETLRLLSPGNPMPASAGEVWRMRAEGLRQFLPGYDAHQSIAPRAGHLVWSPDGKKLAFTLTPDANDYAHYSLWVLAADGSGARQVSPRDKRGYLAPVWIDNSRLGALSPRAGRFDVVAIDLPGEGKAAGKRTLGAIETSDCDWSPDRRRIVYAMPPDIRVRSPQSTTLRQLPTGLSQSH